MNVAPRSTRASGRGRFIWLAVVVGTAPWLYSVSTGQTGQTGIADRALLIGGIYALTTSWLALAYTRVWVAITPAQAALVGLGFTAPLAAIVFMGPGVLFLLPAVILWLVAFALRIREGVGIIGGFLSVVVGLALGVLLLILVT